MTYRNKSESKIYTYYFIFFGKNINDILHNRDVWKIPFKNKTMDNLDGKVFAFILNPFLFFQLPPLKGSTTGLFCKMPVTFKIWKLTFKSLKIEEAK